MRLAEIEAEVAAAFGLAVDEMASRSRKRHLVWPRQAVWWLAKRHCTVSYPFLGRRYGLHHTTVMHGVRSTEERVGAMKIGQAPPEEIAAFAATVAWIDRAASSTRGE